MSSPSIQFKITLTSSREQPFKVVSVPPDAPFPSVLRFAAKLFNLSPAEADALAAITIDGSGINPAQSAADIAAKYGSEIRLVPRDRVGAA